MNVPPRDARFYDRIKAGMDFDFAVLLLLLSSPLLLALALWIKLGSRGPVFYRGVRVGRNGKPFRIFKFRTMVVNAEQIGGPSTADDDPRITSAGRFLRKTKLDELPQLLNIVRFEMSFVGPRPEVPYYADQFTEEEKEILTVRPGITDWASIWNHDEGAVLKGSPDPEKTYAEKIRPQKIRLQLRYVRERSFRTDCKIVLATAVTLLRLHRSPPEAESS